MEKKTRLGLKVALLEEGKSQRAVAREARISESTLSMIVNGRLVPSVTEKAVISAVLRKSESELFGSADSSSEG